MRQAFFFILFKMSIFYVILNKYKGYYKEIKSFFVTKKIKELKVK